MWPFSAPVTPKQAADERDARFLDLGKQLDEIIYRLKLIEREHDALHAAYRRLRGQRAGEAAASPKAPPDEELQDDPREPGFDKEALRRKYLGRKVGGNGQT